MNNRKIPPERQVFYYIGQALMVIGFLTFASVFVTGVMNMGDFSNFHGNAKSSGIRAILGMGMIILGGTLRGIGLKGLAGSGMILDPESASKDVEPWSRMSGRIIRDTVDESGILDEIRKPAGDSAMSFDEKLRRLHQLHKDGILTDEEYQREKQEVLDAS